MSHPLFLYGTLLPELVSGEIAGIVAQLEPLGPATVRGRLYDLGPYPAAVLEPADDVIVGELFRLPQDPAVLAAFDTYEGCPPGSEEDGLYVRVAGTALRSAGTTCDCWVYVYNRDTASAERIPGGDYRAWRRRA